MFRKSFFILINVFIFTNLGLAQKHDAAAAKVDPAQGVHDAFDRFVEGIKRVDADKVMASYAKSNDLLVFNNNGTATKGWTDLDDVTRKIYAKLSNVSLDITGLTIRMLGTSSAYVTCKWKQSQENSGKLENASGRWTLVYQLVGKDWKIVHRHTSPDNPDASRPVFPSEKTP